MKNVLDVGQCRPDHATIRHLVESHFDARVTQSHNADDALAKLRAGRFDLVLVNRKLDADYTDGLEIIQQMKADPKLADIPVMLVSNFSEYQQEAVAAGAEPGFGKAQTDEPETHKRLEKFLS